ncbi:YeeE/YedE family protein [Rhexocercosporidium sp. MPI-PUGE-AT-0058]|nr:YeeE/YedE family protein [Rhexocercosporidium sp. MPI-PUGE-AT-0058]
MATMIKSMLSGSIFGAALIAAGVYSPSVIIGQMQLSDFHMLKTFLAASASSAIAIILANKFNISSCKPRTPATLNLFSSYDGNIIGGALLGFGMSLTGACPGTLIPQLATGVPSGPLVLFGGLVGGILYSRFGKPLLGKVQDKTLMERPTVFQALEFKQGNAMAVYEVICLAMIGSLTHYFPDEVDLLAPSILGGLLIGFSQVMSLLLTGGTLGISYTYEQLGDLFWWAEESILESRTAPRPSIKSTAFAVGTVLGSWGLFKYVDLPTPSSNFHIGATRAVLGGIFLTFGSRIAGGCTSGHGISGMSQLSISSIITVAAMFGGGVALAAFFK